MAIQQSVEEVSQSMKKESSVWAKMFLELKEENRQLRNKMAHVILENSTLNKQTI